MKWHWRGLAVKTVSQCVSWTVKQLGSVEKKIGCVVIVIVIAIAISSDSRRSRTSRKSSSIASMALTLPQTKQLLHTLLSKYIHTYLHIVAFTYVRAICRQMPIFNQFVALLSIGSGPLQQLKLHCSHSVAQKWQRHLMRWLR